MSNVCRRRAWIGGSATAVAGGLPASPSHAPQGTAAASTASDPTVGLRVAATVLAPGVHPAPNQPETARYGTGPALETAEEAFMLSSRLSLRAAGSALDEPRPRLLGLEVR
ncbi:lantibiotic dehydratase C-terminal domain-containing protein [Streptomyces sp. NPDC004667]|uniref:lantibiotic dehydratase C-terminal domain-containing protein n=1 Tax=Streptomyces sp. NPDC004667 TaxID=3154285 RepID=UPI0033A5AFD1